MPYLTKRALSGLRDYRYKPAGYTPIDGWHQPIWNRKYPIFIHPHRDYTQDI